METLLVVLVIGCALAFVVQVARGIWARARTVERHQQALDTLAGLTQRPEASDDNSTGLSEHQAHVRLIGPGGQVSPAETAALPPPRALPSRVSPFQRPSRTLPPGAALEAPAYGASAFEPSTASAYIADPDATRPSPAVSSSPPVGQAPVGQAPVGQAPVGQAQYWEPQYRDPQYGEPEYGEPAEADVPGPTTMPGLPPQTAQPFEPVGQSATPGQTFVEPPTAPVPIVQPQVFYFDDLYSRGEGPEGPSAKRHRLSRRRRRSQETAEHMLPALPPPAPILASPNSATPNSATPNSATPGSAPPNLAPSNSISPGPAPPALTVGEIPHAPKAGGHGAGGRHASGRNPGRGAGRKSVVGVVLAAAAICVAVVAIGVTIVGLPGSGTPGAQTAAKTNPPTSTAHSTTTTHPKPTTTTTPPKPAVLVSSQNGTATYELKSASASIVVSSTGPCWFEVRANSPLGQIINEGTLEAGSRFSVTGPAWIRLGNPPAVAVKVDGTPMTVPDSEVGLPLNLQFTLG
jgi:hypothetical protein